MCVCNQLYDISACLERHQKSPGVTLWSSNMASWKFPEYSSMILPANKTSMASSGIFPYFPMNFPYFIAWSLPH